MTAGWKKSLLLFPAAVLLSLLLVAVGGSAYLLGSARAGVDMSTLGEGRLIGEYYVIWKESQRGMEAVHGWLDESTEAQLHLLRQMEPRVSSEHQSDIGNWIRIGEELLREIRGEVTTTRVERLREE